jgi:hypothetical protein
MQNYSSNRPNRPPNFSTYDEPRLKLLAQNILAPCFEVEPEVVGKFLPDGSRVVIDYILRPKPALVAKGFIDQPIGLEVKSANVSQPGTQGLALAWQCITYSMSEFKGQRPAFVLMFLGLSYFWTEPERMIPAMIGALLMRSNVGHLDVNPRDVNTWKLAFGGGSYFSSRYGMGAQPQAALKRRVGNSK